MGKNTSKRSNGGAKIKKKKSSSSSSAASPGKDNKELQSLPTMTHRRNIISFVVILIAAILGLVLRQHHVNGSDTHDTSKSHQEQKMDKFLSWIIENGGSISPHITLNIFPEYGGYGLMSISSDSSNDLSSQDEKTGQKVDDRKEKKKSSEAIIKHLDEMFTIPPNIITSVESILKKYSSDMPDIRQRLERSVRTNFPSPLEQQDVIIALSLMAECSLGRHSALKPYLDVLPIDAVARLDTFNDNELVELQDDYLSSLAKESAKRMKMAWEQGRSDGGLKRLAKLMANHATTAITSSDKISLDKTCLTYGSFHKYTSIVSSRAMVLYGTKYLTPLADMLNYAPQKKRDTCHKKASLPPPSIESFTLYHQRHTTSNRGDSGSITVRSDRDIFQGGVQIFEDYGSVDNSLFLEAHGFVPDENPSHCAVISPAHFSLGNENMETDLQKEILNAMRYLNILPPSTSEDNDTPIICVKPDGSISEKRAASYLAISNLWQLKSKHISSREEKQKRCLDAVKRDDAELAAMHCLQYAGWRDALNDAVQQSACYTLRESKTGLEFDLELLEILHGMKELSAGKMNNSDGVAVTKEDVQRLNTTRGIIALKFRVAEKTILSELCEGTEQSDLCSTYAVTEKDTNQDSDKGKDESEYKGDREAALKEFRAYIDSMNLPVNRIKPEYVGNGLRLGVVATENLTKGHIYLSIPDSHSINVGTIFRLMSEDNEESHSYRGSKTIRLKTVLDNIRLSSSNGNNEGGDDGGFQIMLLYLLHERFVAQEMSQWWPYLNILPTIEDLKNTAPLFFDEEKLDYLEGSAVKTRLVEYRVTAQRRFADLSTNYDVVRAIGPEIILDWDKFLWAYAILDSRSIWWDGKRNLVPLLDLVNCMEIYDEKDDKERVPNAVHKTVLDKNGENAETKLSHTVQIGDQVYENYGQPNYIYFLYHGFILEDNTHDCALWDDVRIRQSDIATTNMNRQVMQQHLVRSGFSSFEPSFCIKDLSSLHRVADFLRIKYGMDNEENLEGVGNDVNDYIRGMLQKTLYRYDQTILPKKEKKPEKKYDGNGMSHTERTMLRLVQNERAHFQRALEELNQEPYLLEH